MLMSCRQFQGTGRAGLASALAYNYYSGTQNVKLDGRESGGFRGRGCKELSSELREEEFLYNSKGSLF